FRNFRLPSQKSSAATCRQKFASSKADHTDVTPGSGTPPVNKRSWILTGVFDHRDAKWIRDPPDLRKVDNASVQMSDKDRACLRCYRRGDAVRIDLPGFWKQVDKNR